MKTTSVSYGGTDANVRMEVFDINGRGTDAIPLNEVKNNDDPFEQGDVDRFEFKSTKRLGEFVYFLCKGCI